MDGRKGFRELPVYTVDAFTSRPFSGNPAAVVLLPRNHGMDDGIRQKIAAELNLSETAFLQCDGDDDFTLGSRFQLRWFTPTTEVSLCGHATLASAAVLFFAVGNSSEVLKFKTKSGVLTTSREKEELVLNFPLNLSVNKRKEDYRDLIQKIVDFDKVDCVEYSETTKKLLLRLSDNNSRHYLEGLKPLPEQLLACQSPSDVRGVIVTVKASANQVLAGQETTAAYDFFSRYFAPRNGIPEDPVTGSAHTVLASYWSKQLSKTDLFARQCSPRGGDIRIRVRGERVELIGRAMLMFSGHMIV